MFLDALLAEKGMKIDKVIELAGSDETLLSRIVGRFSCKKCGTFYSHKHNDTKVEGICDVCGGKEFVKRADDYEATVRKRLEIYRSLTKPMVPFYKGKGVLVTVDGMGSVEETTTKIERFLSNEKLDYRAESL